MEEGSCAMEEASPRSRRDSLVLSERRLLVLHKEGEKYSARKGHIQNYPEIAGRRLAFLLCELEGLFID